MNTKGLVHIYCGNGKGKTTAATGLAVRCLGAGKKVLFVQFFKDGNSSEIKVLEQMEHIRILHATAVYGRVSRINNDQKIQAGIDYTKLFEEAVQLAETYDLLILDEIISSCNYKIVDEKQVTAFLDTKPVHLEVVLTGRNPSEALMDRADYITSMDKVKHPYDSGIMARKGIEL